jgi:hypothetical protein
MRALVWRLVCVQWYRGAAQPCTPVEHVFLLAFLARHVEQDERKCVQINIVVHLLRRRVVLVVLIAPERSRHPAARPVKHDLRVVEDVPPS